LPELRRDYLPVQPTRLLSEGGEKTLVPSFNDSHLHVLRLGLLKSVIDLRRALTWTEMKAEVREKVESGKMSENDWIVGHGLKDNNFKDLDHLLTADDVEELDLDKPAFFLHDSGHECVVNHKALGVLQDEDALAQYHDAFIERDDDGNMTGRFTDTAVHYIKFNFRQKSEKAIQTALLDAIPTLLKNGITSVQTDDLNFAGSYKRLWQAYRNLEEQGDLPIKVYLHHYAFDTENTKNFFDSFEMRSGEGSERVRVGAFKIFLDGTQRLHTAALRAPYHDQPDTRGNPIYTQEELNELVGLADENRMQMTMHACGDYAVEEAVTAIEQAGSPDMRHRIIHVQTLVPDLLTRLREADCYVEIQPGSMASEYKQYEEWFGKERAPSCNMANSIPEHGIDFAATSDCPVDPLDPHNNIFVGVNRTDKQGNPEGDGCPKRRCRWIRFTKHIQKRRPGWNLKKIQKACLKKGMLQMSCCCRIIRKRFPKKS
jgi:predicted amidohydrolase YtcJ